MREILQNPYWAQAKASRKLQALFGRISGILLAIALCALFDGLIAQMRAGSNELEFLPGQSMTISGPAVLKNPLASDLIARFSPADAPLHFEMEGFFTGYWFGNGMWRGKISAEENCETGTYNLRISFRGASAQTAQNYILKVFANAEAKREAALSLIQRYLDLNPFILAAIAGIAGILAGCLTYIKGRSYARLLATLGLAEIYRSRDEDGSIWCLSPASLAPKSGNARMVLKSDGTLLGEARSEEWRKGKLRLTMLNAAPVPPGALVCLKPPQIFAAANSYKK